MISATLFSQENLVYNGDFELTENGLPRGWTADTYNNNPHGVLFGIGHRDPYSGRNYAVIENLISDDSKLIQEVEVVPDTVYRISCEAKAFDMGPEGLGANISLVDIQETSADVRQSPDAWRRLELYGRTGPDQHAVALTLRLGGYGLMSTGTAYFDNVRMEKVSHVPQGVRVVNFSAPSPEPNRQSRDQGGSRAYTVPVTVLIALLFLLVVYYVYRRALRHKPVGLTASEIRRTDLLLMVTLAAGFFVRLIPAVGVQGFPTDIACFKTWAVTAFDKGLPNFYQQNMFVDYPPGYIYILYILGFLRSILGLPYDSPAFLLLIKLPSIITDLLLALLIYRFARKRLGASSVSRARVLSGDLGASAASGSRAAPGALGAPNAHAAYFLALLFIINPVVIHNSALFGQIDSFFSFFLVLSLYLLYRKKIEPAAVLYAAAVLIKPQALIFAPAGIYALVKLFSGKPDYRRIGVTIACMILTFTLPVLPFCLNGNGIARFFTLYGNTLASYPYATVNAFNLYALLGANWQGLESPLLFFSFGTWGLIFILGITGAVLVLCVRDYKTHRNPAFYFFVALFLITAVFVLGTRMHERYLYPALPLSLLCFIAFKDKRFLFLFAGFSATLLLNQEMVLNFFLSTGGTLIPRDDILVRIASLVNLALLCYLGKIGIDLFFRNRPAVKLRQRRSQPILPARMRVGYVSSFGWGFRSKGYGGGQYPFDPEYEPPLALPYERACYVKREYLAVFILTLVYACVAFINLGSCKAPQTYWRPARAGEGFYADLGREERIGRVYYFFGLGAGSYSIEFSRDNNHWSRPLVISQPTVYDFIQWRYTVVDRETRYLKVTAKQPGVMLDELGLFPKDSTVPLTIKSVTPFKTDQARGPGPAPDLGKPAANSGPAPGHGRPEAVFDEQNTIVYNPGYLDGFVFDEVYFARTAYENLLGIPPSETTHPPLGKLIISLGIMLFGMVPLGWRFAGTLCGVLMVPLMYAFGKKLFKDGRPAFVTAFLFTFDFMHFVQTRIATIDVYAVFFIILMYYFMYDYYRMSFFKQSLWRTFRPLLFAGVCLGLGAACKWTALYGALGLAVIFFITIFRRLREYVRARRVLQKAGTVTLFGQERQALVYKGREVPQRQTLEYRYRRRHFLPNLGKTLLWCVAVFVIIPTLIYYLSYLPILTAEKPVNPVGFVINDQVNMYDYHSRLTAGHPFSSSWWQWPFMERPMWYYSGHEQLPANLVSSIVAFGNPAVWWVGGICLLAAAFIAVYRRDGRVLFIITAFLSQYLPWIIIPRDLTFIYHFFTAVPFLVFCIVYVLIFMVNRIPWLKYAAYAYLVSVPALFVLFYPVLSGLAVPKAYMASVLRWFTSWVFYI